MKLPELHTVSTLALVELRRYKPNTTSVVKDHRREGTTPIKVLLDRECPAPLGRATKTRGKK